MWRAMPAVGVALVLAAFAWHPAGLPEAFAHQDKLAHLLGFAALACALRLGLPHLSLQEHAGALLLAAAAIELGQTFIPARVGTMGDLLADGVGGVFGIALADAWHQWRRPSPPPGAAASIPDPGGDGGPT